MTTAGACCTALEGCGCICLMLGARLVGVPSKVMCVVDSEALWSGLCCCHLYRG